MPIYHYRINLIQSEQGKFVGYEAKQVDGVSPLELPHSLFSAMNKFTNEFLNEFRRDPNCPKTLDIKLEF